MLTELKQKIYGSSAFTACFKKLVADNRLCVHGLRGSALSFFLAFLFEQGQRQLLYIAPDITKAEQVTGDLESLLGESQVGHYPALSYRGVSLSRFRPEQIGMRLKLLEKLIQGERLVITTCLPAVVEAIPDLSHLTFQRLELCSQQDFSFEKLIEALVDFGYERVDLVSGVGEFSVRGGILDVFPYEESEPVRLEFFGDHIESIRVFDVATQRSKKFVERVIIMAPDLVQGEESLISKGWSSLIHFLQSDAILVLDEPERWEKVLMDSRDQGAEIFPGWSKLNVSDREATEGTMPVFSVDKIKEFCRPFTKVQHFLLGKNSTEAISFAITTQEDFRGNIRLLRKKIKSIFDESETLTKRHVFLLLEAQFEVERITDLFQDDKLPQVNLHIGVGTLNAGFNFPSAGISVFTERDLYGRMPRRRSWGKFRGGIPIKKLNAIQPGDYMVHVDHGIGRFLGLEKITVNKSERECLKLLYRDGDILYVPIDKLHRVQKFSGTEGVQPQLHKLGGKDWERVKAKTKKSVEKIARDLIEIYATRKAQTGVAFAQDTLWQREMEASFVYDETPDQLRTIAEVKGDMEKPTPMDRLVCGDVGFGKTEVALRAAFKAVMDNKQVAILVPTTVLAVQHFNTFRERLQNYPVQVEMLSRFRTPKQQQKVLEGLRTGQVDIVIGTHRLLSDDVKFKDLGLLVVDEEHRFGVRQKELLKKRFKLVDVLTMTATPIPRTLYFSMMGARDMSTMNTPPCNRLPVITQVVPFDKDLIREAILQEVRRGGQVFFVHNRVQSIDAVFTMLRKLLPEVRFGVAHGQMRSHDLEKVMLDFLNKKFDCLISTMIIESGLDMPNVNTLIVNRADKFGLAQLYQLRGRVGRSNRQAYAYFLVPPFKLLTETALERLQTLEEFMELGSGLPIAQKDLEIRGAGNLLGPQQSGFINAVGFELYCKILDEAVQKLKGETVEDREEVPEVETLVDADCPAYIPEDYVAMDYERLDIYHRLNATRKLDELEDLEEELRDRFGPLPEQTRMLFDLTALRILANQLGLEKIRMRNGELVAYFSDAFFSLSKHKELLEKILGSIVKYSSNSLNFLQGQKFGFRLRLSSQNEGSLVFAKTFFEKVVRKVA